MSYPHLDPLSAKDIIGIIDGIWMGYVDKL